MTHSSVLVFLVLFLRFLVLFLLSLVLFLIFFVFLARMPRHVTLLRYQVLEFGYGR